MVIDISQKNVLLKGNYGKLILLKCNNCIIKKKVGFLKRGYYFETEGVYTNHSIIDSTCGLLP